MFLVIAFLSLLGCPLPPDDNDGPQIPTLQQGQNKGGAQGGRPPGAPANNAAGGAPGKPPVAGGPAGAGKGEKPSGAPGGVLLDMTQMSAQKTQEEIATQDHVTISGKIIGTCAGTMRLDIIKTESLGGPKEGEDMKGPITTLVVDSTGVFKALVPKSSSVNLTALCDADNNQKITADADQLSLGARLGVVDEDVSDVSLTLEEIKPPSAEEAPRTKED